MTTHTLDLATLARRAKGFHPSPVRSVFEVSMQPGMISLAGGNPDLSLMPLDEIGQIAGRLVATKGREALQYGGSAGWPELIDLVRELVEPIGIDAAHDEVLITAGSQMGIDLMATMLCDPGDVILAEGPTYVGALGAFDGLEARVEHVATDEHGMLPDALDATIARVRAAGGTIRMLYTVPNFGNPSGITLALERRSAIVETCVREGILIVEDDPYGMLAFDGTHPASLRSLAPQHVVYLGSFSKIFSPGVRVGWLIAPRLLRERLQLALEAVTICASPLSQMLVHESFRTLDWTRRIRDAASVYAERAHAVLGALETSMPAGTTWSVPRGGFFTWLTLPGGVDSERLLTDAIDEGVVAVPGTAFFADGSGADNLRIAYSFAEPEVLREGVARLARAIGRQLD